VSVYLSLFRLRCTHLNKLICFFVAAGERPYGKGSDSGTGLLVCLSAANNRPPHTHTHQSSTDFHRLVFFTYPVYLTT